MASRADMFGQMAPPRRRMGPRVFPQVNAVQVAAALAPAAPPEQVRAVVPAVVPAVTPDDTVVGEVVRATVWYADDEAAGATGMEKVQAGTRLTLSYPMQKVAVEDGEEVRMRAKIVDPVTGSVGWRWMVVYREQGGARERLVRFASA